MSFHKTICRHVDQAHTNKECTEMLTLCKGIILLAAATLALKGANVMTPEIVAVTKDQGSFQKKFFIQDLPEELVAAIKTNTWRKGCPVEIEQLRLLTVSFWNFHGMPSTGTLIVNRSVAKDLIEIFKKLYRHGFLIERMEPIENFGGSDERSMAANNTSAFNCRDITGKPGIYSNHSWGLAIDINPLTNPYVRGSTVAPDAARAYLDRSKAYMGGILSDGFIVRLFKERGWTWGGDWNDLKDFQHFEKTARRP